MASQAARPTLAKVALLAHVSTATASNVLAGKGRVSPETVARVQEAAARIGYRTNAGARALSLGRTTTIGVVVATGVDALIAQRNSFFWLRLLDAFVTRCSELEVTAAIVNETQTQSLLDSGVDAVVLLGPPQDETIAALDAQFGLPIVSASPFGSHDATFPTHDASAIARTVVAEFARLGRTRLAWMPGPNTDALVGWRDALQEASTGAGMGMIELGHGDSRESISAALGQPESESVDAVFGLFMNPRFLIDAVTNTGKRIPDDISVIVQSEGILEEVTAPSLSNLSLCGAQCGTMLAEHVVGVAAGEAVAVETLPFTFVARESTEACGGDV